MSIYEGLSLAVSLIGIASIVWTVREWTNATRDLSRRVDRLNALLDDDGVYTSDEPPPNVFRFPSVR